MAVALRPLCASCLIAPLVCVQDNIVQPWEGEYLDWADFSIRVANEDMPQLADILQQVTPEEIQRLQEGMQRVWPRFLWHSALEVSGSPWCCAGDRRGRTPAASGGRGRPTGSKPQEARRCNLV